MMLYQKLQMSTRCVTENADLNASGVVALSAGSNVKTRFSPGTSVTAFVRLQRLAAARRLLETTDDTVSDIAQACGFYDHSHFANAFRRAFGRSPGAWRAGRRS